MVRPSTEGDVCVPISPYAVTKLAAEHLCRIHTLGGRMSCISLRPFSVYGPRQREGLAILRFLKAVHTGVPITVFGDGSMERDFTYVGDIARCVVNAMTAATCASDIVNIGAGQPITLKALIKVIQEVTGKIALINMSTLQFGDVAVTCADNVKAKRILQIENFISLREGLRHTLEWMMIERFRSATVAKRIA